MPPATWKTLALDRGDHGVRVDRVVLRHLRDHPGVSRNQVQTLIDIGEVLVNGAPAPRAAWRIKPGDGVRVRVAPPRPRARATAEPIPLDVVFEDDHLLAINKPSGLVVHPSYKNAAGTLINGVLDLARSWPPGDRPSLLGRLDKYTSGVVLVAKRPEVHAALQRAMAARRIDKDYLAVVWGKPSPARGTINLALDRDPWDRRRITVTDRGGQPAVTLYQRRAAVPAGPEHGSPFSLVRCRLVTGRTHQIRVHLAAKGWPIVGDAVYGRPASASDDPCVGTARRFPRQALHAWELTLRHPVTGLPLSMVAPLPSDLQGLLRDLGLPDVSS